MKNPFEQVALILTYIRGDRVNNWARHQLTQLTDKVTTKKYKDTDKELWKEFEKAFTNTFKDLGQTQDAHTQLKTLKIKDGNVDKYNALFNQLIDEAGFPKTKKGTIEMYKDGLNSNLHIKIRVWHRYR
jgi:Retrotransposon gag protein